MDRIVTNRLQDLSLPVQGNIDASKPKTWNFYGVGPPIGPQVVLFNKRTGRPLKDQGRARRRLKAIRKQQQAEMLAKSVAGVEVPLP